MTPERKEYLMEHNGREETIRHLIRGYKHELKKCKAVCSSYDLKRIGRKPLGYRIHIVQVNETKLIINALRHELQRLKGMDRVFSRGKAPVKQSEFHSGIEYSAFYCGDCGYIVEVVEDDGEFKKSTIKFCPYCGRRILWGR